MLMMCVSVKRVKPEAVSRSRKSGARTPDKGVPRAGSRPRFGQLLVDGYGLCRRRRNHRSDLRANHVARNNNLDAAILLPPGARIVGSDWIRFPKSLCRGRRRIQALPHHVVVNRPRALPGKVLVECIGSDAV